MTIRCENLRGRPLQISEEVRRRNGIWEAYDQGRLAYHIPGWNKNPHLDGHMNASDWQRGFDYEATCFPNS